MKRIPGFLGFLAAVCLLAVSAAGAPADPLRPWTEYRTIMWVGDSAYKQPEKVPLFYQRLREMGINTAMVYSDGNLKPLLDNQFPFYVENMVNKGLCLKWNSNVRDWDKFVTTWTKGGRPESALVRDYCLDDPKWREWARRQMQQLARKCAPHNPLAYDIRDELSTTISANPFDYDFSPITLGKFREWLQTQYKDLAALNAQWETKFATWDEVKPFTTDQIKNRLASGDALPQGNPDWQAVQRIKFEPAEARKQTTRWNFSPWCDFRTYMDISLAAALDDCRQAARVVDPRTPVGIEGTQMPHAFGGYDLWRLSQVLDWVEPYDIGSSREIFGSFMPGKTVLCTVFEKDTRPAQRRLWHLLLEGDKGCIIWWSEDCLDWRSPDYALTAKARALAPVLKEMTSPLAQLFLRAQREYDPIAIHYSQPSIQVDWLIESMVDGSTWHRRFSSHEADHNRMAKVRQAWLKIFQDLGYSPRFVHSSQLERREVWEKCCVLVLPTAQAMSEGEIAGVTEFLTLSEESVPRWVFADGAPGLFDQHGRLRASNPLHSLFADASSQERSSVVIGQMSKPGSAKAGDIALAGRQRLAAEPNLEWAKWVAESLKGPGGKELLSREVTVPLESRTRIHRFKAGPAQLLAFERSISYHMSEDLKQAGGNEQLEKPIDSEARLAKAAHVYDLRARKYLGQTDRIAFHLDPWQPSLFALLSEKVAEERIVEALLEQAGR
jgi:hypothetical protein